MISSLDNTQKIYMNEKGREEFFKFVFDAQNSGEDPYGYFTADFIERYALGETWRFESAFRAIKAALKREYKEWLKTHNYTDKNKTYALISHYESTMPYKIVQCWDTSKIKYIKTSNSIEDLFDDIVIDDKRWGKGNNIKYRRHFLASCLHDQREYQAMWPDHKNDIKLDKEGLLVHLTIFQNPVYGGVWTDNGFIYLAKLKTDGSWELLGED